MCQRLNSFLPNLFLQHSDIEIIQAISGCIVVSHAVIPAYAYLGEGISLTSPTNQNSSLHISVIRPSFILPSSKILSSFIDNYVSLVFSFIKSNSLFTTSSQEKGSLCFILTNNHQGGSEPTNQRQRITCGGWLWRHSKIREREN